MENLENEKWFDIEGCEGRYQISDKLRIKRVSREIQGRENPIILKEMICKIHIANTGYYCVNLYGGKLRTLHRIIANTFIPNPENKPMVNHKNGIKTDCSIENLEWVTAKENLRHAFVNGLRIMSRRNGKDNPFCSISIDVVNEIKALKGKEFLRLTAERFKISIAQVWNIQNGKQRRIK